MAQPSLSRYAWLSIAAALATILLKGLAWRLTDSVGLLSMRSSRSSIWPAH
jgi:divalent metal cation (Fe/Co/Zn/Cd) transporter